jgi:RNA polymerase sigma-32 factor
MRSVSAGDSGFQRYVSMIQQYPPLSREEEVVLARRWLEHHDRQAAEKLVKANLRFVVRIAAGYRGYGFRIADLAEEGNLGLLEAIKRFDPDRGHRFMTYATYWIRAYILAYVLKSWSLVGVGTGPLQSKLFFRLQRERARMTARLGSGADADRRLARKFGTSEDRIREMQHRLDGRDQSLDTFVFRDGYATGMDMLADEHASQELGYEQHERDLMVRERLATAMRLFDARECYIVRSRLLADDRLTLAEIGRQLGLSRERVRQIESRIKAKLRHSMEDIEEDEFRAVA